MAVEKPSQEDESTGGSTDTVEETDAVTTIKGITIEGIDWAKNTVKAATEGALNFFSDKAKESNKTPHAALGMPPIFHEGDDPNLRAYKKFIMTDTRFVSFTPGKPLFFRAKNEDGEVINAKDAEDTLGFFGDDQGIASYLSANIRNQPDFRYYGFKADNTDYTRYVDFIFTTIYAKMKTSGSESKTLVGRLEDEYEPEVFNSGVSFFLNKGTTVNEVVSNDFGASKLDGLAKSASGIFKEMKYLLGTTGAEQTADDLKDKNEAVQSQISELSESGGVLDSILGLGNIGGIDKVGTVVNGSQLLFPHVWNDSTFDRSYNLTFKLTSPYGDVNSIFRSIYVPFAALLAMAMPRQDTFMGYFSPFICRVDCPGFFMSDMAVITSLSWRKGGSDDLFTKDGYPLEIEVNITLRDLYPVLMMSKEYSTMKASNIGFAMFLDNLAGLGVDDSKILSNIEGWFSRKLSPILSIDETIKNKIRDNETVRSVLKLFNSN